MPGEQNKLIKSATDSGSLNKQERTFNERVARINELKESLAALKADLQSWREKLLTELAPLDKKIANRRKSLILLFAAYYGNMQHGRRKEVLQAVIHDLYEQVLSQQDPDDELEEAFAKVFGQSIDEAVADNEERIRREQEAENDGHINWEELEAEIENGREKQPATNGKPGENRLKKDLLKKAKAELERKTIRSVYLRLARSLHPDTEAVEEEKQRKEELMKQVTVAFGKNDLYALLSMELEWLSKEEKGKSAQEDHLKIYNKALHQQIKDLEAESERIRNHPDNRELYRQIVVHGNHGMQNFRQMVNQHKAYAKHLGELVIYASHSEDTLGEIIDQSIADLEKSL